MSSSSQSLNLMGTGRLVALFSHQKRLGQNALVNDESVFRNSNPENVAKSLPDGNRDHLLTQTRSELMKQELKVESPNNCISEFQQQAYAQRLEFENVHQGNVESRREQVRLQEELVVEEKSLSRHSDSRYARDGRNEESILCAEIERKS